MKTLVTASQMQLADQRTIEEMEMPSPVLMERAAMAVAQKIFEVSPKEKGMVLVVCGNGNNGGDGVAVARLLHLAGYRVRFLMAMGEEKLSAECARQLHIARNYHVPQLDQFETFGDLALLVDALFGIGLSRPIEGDLAVLIGRMNACPCLKVAVDIPSGVSADTGAVMGIAMEADYTVTFGLGKIGQYIYPGRRLCGELSVADVGIYLTSMMPHNIECLALLEEEDLDWVVHRNPEGNKGTFGKLLLVSGAVGMAGAAQLASVAALRAGAGMAKVVTVPENLLALQIGVPEAMVDVEESEGRWAQDVLWSDGLVIGPGLGKGKEARRKVDYFLSQAQKRALPVVLDADGLNILAEDSSLQRYLTPQCVLTPHVGEMARLLQKEVAEVKEDLVGAAAALSCQLGCVVVLKDSSTVVVSQDGEGYLCPGGNPGMATAGSGDVLAGIVGACLVQGRNRYLSVAFRAACAVKMHSDGGALAASASPHGRMLAGDIPTQFSFWRREQERGV